MKAASEKILPQIQEIPFLLHFLESPVLPMTTEITFQILFTFYHIVMRMPMMTAYSTHIFTRLPWRTIWPSLASATLYNEESNYQNQNNYALYRLSALLVNKQCITPNKRQNNFSKEA